MTSLHPIPDGLGILPIGKSGAWKPLLTTRITSPADRWLFVTFRDGIVTIDIPRPSLDLSWEIQLFALVFASMDPLIWVKRESSPFLPTTSAMNFATTAGADRVPRVNGSPSPVEPPWSHRYFRSI